MTKSPTASLSTTSTGSPKMPPVEPATDTTKHIDLPIDQPSPPTMVAEPFVPLDPEIEPFIPTPRRKTGHPRNLYKLQRNSPDEEWWIDSFDHFKVNIISVNDIISMLMKHTDHSIEAWYLL